MPDKSALLEETPVATLTVELPEAPETEDDTETGEELELILDDLVFEEITIDGICGVY